MFCKFCGKKLAQGSSTCKHCGKNLDEASAPPPEKQKKYLPVEIELVHNGKKTRIAMPARVENPDQTVAPKRKRKRIVIVLAWVFGLIASFLLGAIVIGLIMFAVQNARG